MQIIHTREQFPFNVTKKLFLAGPTIRNSNERSWREDAIQILKELKYDGVVFTPEYEEKLNVDLGSDADYSAQVEWEESALNQADIIVFWVPRDMKKLQGLTTNIEFGVWESSGKIVLGYPKDAEKMRYLQYYANKYNIPSSNSLKETLQNALTKIGEGAKRSGGEAQVPLYIWNQPSFQGWLTSQKASGNELRAARVLWNFRPRYKDFMFCWVLHVEVYVKEELRIKSNEFVLSRTDLSSIVLYYNKNPIESIEDILSTNIVLVKEFRSPARTDDSFITELPSGSANKKMDEKDVVLKELHEETSFSIEPHRVQEIQSRQLAGTFSAHISSLYSARLYEDEFKHLKELAESKQTFGEIQDTEITYVEIMSIKDALASNKLDWSNIGMIFSAILK